MHVHVHTLPLYYILLYIPVALLIKSALIHGTYQCCTIYMYVRLCIVNYHACLHFQMLTSKRYDLEGFAEYAHNLNDCQTFHKNEAKHIDYVLRVHGTLRRNGVKVPHTDEVSNCSAVVYNPVARMTSKTVNMCIDF